MVKYVPFTIFMVVIKIVLVNIQNVSEDDKEKTHYQTDPQHHEEDLQDIYSNKIFKRQ